MRVRHDIGRVAVALLVIGVAGCGLRDHDAASHAPVQRAADTTSAATAPWTPPDTATIPHTPDGDLVRYGRALVARTAQYLGPRGSVARRTNGMNCDNCHIDGGTRPYGNTFALVASTYPKFRARSGSMESIEDRINDCFERSLNGAPLDSASREMRAMVAYMQWIGAGAPRAIPDAYAHSESLAYLDRAADTTRGRAVYLATCQRCHGADGAGAMDSARVAYVYPPLWGAHSYNVGAGMYQVSRLAGFVKNNMPFGVTHRAPQLTDEQAWDVAAFVDSRPRPSADLRRDWPKIASKPVDYPFGPYADRFTEAQHKYGPFAPIAAARRPESRIR